MSAVYVFALTSQAVAPFAAEGHRIKFLDLHGIHAAVQHLAKPPRVSESVLRAQHNIVMRLSDRIDAVLPVRFGAWVEEEELKEIVAARQTLIRAALVLVRGRVQMTIRFQDIGGATTRLTPSASIASGAAYLEQRRQASRSLPPGASDLAELLRDLVVADRVASATERSAASVYHLIERRRVPDYLAITSTRFPATAAVTGPWPAFAFAPDLWP